MGTVSADPVGDPGAVAGGAERAWRPSCGRGCAVTTTTRAREAGATTMLRWRGRRWWDGLAWDAYALLACLDERELGPAVDKAGEGWPPWSARTSTATPGRGVPDRPPGRQDRVISRPWTRRRGTDTRPPRAVSMATRATSRSNRTPRSSPPPRSPRATPATPTAADLLAADLPGDGAEDIGDRDVDEPGDSVTTQSRCRRRHRRQRRAALAAPTRTHPTARTAGGLRRRRLRCWRLAGHAGGRARADLHEGAARRPRRMPVRQRPLRRRSRREHGHLPERGHRADPPGQGRWRHRGVGPACAKWPLATRCTSSTAGRTIAIGRYEADSPAPAPPRTNRPGSPSTATRPKVERKIGHLMRRRHGGRRARVRGRTKVAATSLLAAAVNLARSACSDCAAQAQTGLRLRPKPELQPR